MIYRDLGRTGWTVSAIGFGTSPLGGLFGPVDETDGIRTVRTALDLGINFFDVSPFYGATRAETVLGRALEGVERDSYYLATKVGRYGTADFDFSARRVTESIDESMRRLGVEHIDLIQCHDIEFGDLNQIVEETLPALRHLQQQGKVRKVGITGYPLKIFKEVLARTEVDTVLSYCRHTLIDDALQSILPWLVEREVGIINASPLAMGLLSGCPLPEWHPAPDAIKNACAQAAVHCRDKGTSLARLAIQFAVSNPQIAVTFVGTADAELLKSNIAWSQERVDENLLEGVKAILAPIKNQTWPSGRPENND